MKNQSSLNDVFRFAELKSANLLKAYPLLETANILEVQNETIETKKRKAKEILENVDSLVSLLKFGNLIDREVKTIRNGPGGTSNSNYSDESEINEFYGNMRNNHIDVDSDTFKDDLEKLADFIYFSSYTDHPHVSKNDTNVYIAYHILRKAHMDSSFRRKPLFKSFGISNAFIKSVGVADLLVVKQHILRYEATEIAHIENVMIGETRTREHRYLDRFEETLSFENEKTVDIEKETQNEERFEMNRETQKTIEEDQKFSTDLTVSGSMGPTVKFDSNLSYETGSSTSSEISTSSTYAKDIMDRSLEKVTERVRTERITKIIKENETKNLHSFTNVPVEGSATEVNQISGIYQFVDKIYKAQVFNYGERQMFDLMIPEPSSYLSYLNSNDSKISGHGLNEPIKFDISPYDIDIEEREERTGRDPRTGGTLTFNGQSNNFYANLVKRYGATGVKPPPSERIITMSLMHPTPENLPEGKAVNSELGLWLSPARVLDIEIPDKYLPKKLDIEVLCFSDTGHEVRFTFQCVNDQEHTKTIYYHPERSSSGLTMLYSYHQHEVLSGQVSFEFGEEDYQTILSEKNAIKLSYFAIESANHTITIKVNCKPSEELIQEWQLETYDILQTAYQDRLMEFQSKLAQFNADKKAQENFEKSNYGVPPSKQKQVMLTELKKHAIAILTQNEITDGFYVLNYPMTEGAPPKIDRVKAKAQGDFIQFFEQAFEWSQMQYALYPYFWSRQENWEPKFKQDDPNYEYQQFLQASAARLVLSVRPGYEEAVAHYLEEGSIWNGEEPPKVDDPLYVSIINQIKEQSGVTAKEPVAVGAPWEVRIPTSLIKLKEDSELPGWEERPEGSWDWDAK